MTRLLDIVSRILFSIFATLFIIGVILIILNLTSLVVPLRSPAVYSIYQDERKDVLLTYEQTMVQINKQSEESDEEYVYRLTNVISKSISPNWDGEVDKLRLRVPIWENYILWLLSFKEPRVYLRYEYSDYKLALERGVGQCSQYAIVASQIMQDNGIESKILALNGHVLAQAKIDGKWHIVDPEYDVVIPHSLEEVEEDPGIIKEFYGNTWAPPHMSDLFATAEDNFVYDDAIAYIGITTYELEKWAYSAVWDIPLLFIFPFLLVSIIMLLTAKRTYVHVLLPFRNFQKISSNCCKILGS